MATGSVEPPDLVVVPGVVDEDTQRRVVAFLNDHKEWHPWGGARAARAPRATKRELRYRWGEGGEHAIPPVLLEAGAQALANLQERARRGVGITHRAAAASESLADFQLDSLVVNRYFKGEGIGAHRDPPRQNPKVLGITLGTAQETTRTMRFRELKNKSNKVDVVTPPRSAYYFWDRGYTDWTHESVPSKRQVGVVYSLTFRPKRIAP